MVDFIIIDLGFVSINTLGSMPGPYWEMYRYGNVFAPTPTPPAPKPDEDKDGVCTIL